MLYLLYIDTSNMDRSDFLNLIADINRVEYQFLEPDSILFFTIDYIPKIKQDKYKNAKFKTYEYSTDDKIICDLSTLQLTPLNHESRFKKIKKPETLELFKDELRDYPILKDWIK